MLASIAFNYWMAIAMAGRQAAAPGETCAAARLSFTVAVNLVVLGVFKYANFFADNVNALLRRAARAPARGAARAAADRHLVLHVPRHFVRGGRVPGRRDGAEEPGPRGALPAALSPAHRRTDHPLPRYRRSAREAPGDGRRLRRTACAGSSSAWRRRCSSPTSSPDRRIRSSVCRSSELDPARAWLGDRLLHAADLLRLLRLLRHGHRPRPDVRLPISRKLPVAVHRRHGAGLLAPLAHVAVDLVPRLPLRPARRQSAVVHASVRQPGHRLLPVRPVARGELELRDLGPVPRACSWSSNGSASPTA